MSLLLEKGHSQARLYSIIMVQNEAELVRDRIRHDRVMFLTISKLVSDTSIVELKQQDRRKLHEQLQEMTEGLLNGSYG